MKVPSPALLLFLSAMVFPAPPIDTQDPGTWVLRYARPGAFVGAGEEACHPFENGFAWDRDNHVGLVTNGHLGTYSGLEAYWQANYADPGNKNWGQIYNTNQTWLYTHELQAFYRPRPMDRPQKTCGAKTYYDEALHRFVIYGGYFHATDNGHYEVAADGASLVKEDIPASGIRHSRLPWIFDAAAGQWYSMRSIPRGPGGTSFHGYHTNWIYIKDYGLGLLLPALDTRAYAYHAWSNTWTTLQLNAPGALSIGYGSDLPAVYDCRRNRLIVHSKRTTYLYDWDAKSWDSLRPASGPVQGSESSYLGFSAMTYDINADRAIFVSHDGTETWSLDCKTRIWSRASTPIRPQNGGSMGEGFTYDPDRNINLLYSNKGDMVWSWREAATDSSLLGEIRNINAVTTADSIRISWAPPPTGPAADYYRIFRCRWSDHPLLSQGLVPETYTLLDSVPSATFTDAPPKIGGTFYSYSVQPVKGTQTGIRSIPAFSRRPVPLCLVATAMSTGRVKLKWAADTAGDVAGYHVYRAGGAVPIHPLQYPRITALPIGPRPVFEDTTVHLNGDSIFTYMVTTVDRFGHESGFSPRADTRIDRVMGLWLDTVSGTLNWNRTLADTFKCYQVWVQGIGTFEGGVAPATLALNNVTDTFKKVTRYNHYKIRTVNALGQPGHFSDLVPYASIANDNTGMFRGDGMLVPPNPDPVWDRVGRAPDEISVERSARRYAILAGSGFSIQPNPLNREAEVRFKPGSLTGILQRSISVTLFNIRGQRVLEPPLSFDSDHAFQGRLDAAKFAPGLYFLRTRFQDRTYEKRIVIIR